MPDPLDLYSVLAGDDPSAQATAAAYSAALRRQRDLGTLGMLTGDKALSALGEQALGGADKMEQRLGQAQESRVRYLPQMQERQETMEARKNPAYAGLLSQALDQYGMKVPEGAPVQVMEKILPIQERIAQAGIMGQFRAAQQGRLVQKTDPNTGEVYLLRPIDGATFTMGGRQRTAGVAGGGMAGFDGGQGPSQRPQQAPAPAPGSAVTPPAPGAQVAPQEQPQGTAARVLTGGGGAGRFPAMMGKPLDLALQKFGADLDPNKGTGEIQKNQARLNAAIRLRKLVTDENGQIKTMIPPQFMKETAMALAQLVSAGGQPAQSLVEELTPHTGSSKLADIVQWITNNPQDAGQQGFVKLYLESANREATAAQEALNKAVGSRVGKHQRLIRGNPDEARTVAQSFGWNLDPQKMTMTPIETPEVASGASPPKVGGATVNVLWKGKRKTIPAERLQDALKAGATEDR